MYHSALGRIQNAKRKWSPVFADMVAGKTSHRMQLSLAGLSEAIRIHDKSVFAFELASKRLKKDDLERIKHFAILSQCEVRVAAGKVKHTAFVVPLGGNIQIEPHVGHQPGQKILCLFAGLVHVCMT